MESAMMVVCACSHTARRHEDGEEPGDHGGPCKAAGCGCLALRPDGRLEPVLPTVVSAPAVVVPIARPQPDADVAADTGDGPEMCGCGSCQDSGCQHCGPELVATSPRSLEEMLEVGRRSPVKRTRALTEKVVGLLVDLRRVLEEEAVAEAARGRIAELERQLAEERARLRRNRPVQAASATTTAEPGLDGEYGCPDCSEQFTTPQGRGAHRARKHGFRRP